MSWTTLLSNISSTSIPKVELCQIWSEKYIYLFLNFFRLNCCAIYCCRYNLECFATHTDLLDTTFCLNLHFCWEYIPLFSPVLFLPEVVVMCHEFCKEMFVFLTAVLSFSNIFLDPILSIRLRLFNEILAIRN